MKLREYFFNKTDMPLYKSLRQADRNFSALNLSGEVETTLRSVNQLREEWSSKTLHGRYPAQLQRVNISDSHSNNYLTAGYLFPETEGAVLAIQDQIVPILAYKKHVIDEAINDERR